VGPGTPHPKPVSNISPIPITKLRRQYRAARHILTMAGLTVARHFAYLPTIARGR